MVMVNEEGKNESGYPFKHGRYTSGHLMFSVSIKCLTRIILLVKLT